MLFLPISFLAWKLTGSIATPAITKVSVGVNTMANLHFKTFIKYTKMIGILNYCLAKYIFSPSSCPGFPPHSVMVPAILIPNKI